MNPNDPNFYRRPVLHAFLRLEPTATATLYIDGDLDTHAVERLRRFLNLTLDALAEDAKKNDPIKAETVSNEG